MPVTINTTANGPFVIAPEDAARVTLLDTGGAPVPGADANARAGIALCRCGQSANKPFCDGTHSTIGFTDNA